MVYFVNFTSDDPEKQAETEAAGSLAFCSSLCYN